MLLTNVKENILLKCILQSRQVKIHIFQFQR